MHVSKEELQFLGEIVEKIVFNEQELAELKKLITTVSTQETPPRVLKERILEMRSMILNRIVEIFPFYCKKLLNQREINWFGNNTEPTELKKELEDRNSILEQIADKLQDLETKLQKEVVKL